MWIKTVNKAITAEGMNLELVAGDGYFYFVGPGTENLSTASVMVYRLNELSLDQWMTEAREVARLITNYEDERDGRY
jgi:hypothetical protein